MDTFINMRDIENTRGGTKLFWGPTNNLETE
jgi:hypothetical protein